MESKLDLGSMNEHINCESFKEKQFKSSLEKKLHFNGKASNDLIQHKFVVCMT
jgi:hypothetical protein